VVLTPDPCVLPTEGVIVAHKDKHKIKNHAEIKVEGAATTIPQVQVTQLMKSLKSRGFVSESFNWQWYYYYLTNEGIEYLREYLHLPTEVVPDTLKKAAPARARAGERPGEREGGFEGDREEGKGKGKGKGGKGFGRGGGEGRGGGFGGGRD
jgi:small subunit ribosomal protein S10e